MAAKQAFDESNHGFFPLKFTNCLFSLVCFDYSEETYRQEDVTCSVEQGFEMGRQLALRLMEMISTGECDDRNYTYVMKPILYDGHSIRKIKKVK
jgi:GntR family transcriptional regulator of arabinose operon